VKNASYPQTVCNLDEQGRVLDVSDLLCWRVRDIQRQPKDVHIGFAEVDVAGGDVCVYDVVELEPLDAVVIQYASLVANHDDLQPVLGLELTNQREHLRVGRRLCEHESSKLGPSEWPASKEDHVVQILVLGQLAFLVGVENHLMSRFHFDWFKSEFPYRASSCTMVPSIGKQDTTDVHKQRPD
jgi:hypothetical protein